MKAKPGADCDTNHKLLVAIFKLRLKKREFQPRTKATEIADPASFQDHLLRKGIPQTDALNAEEAWGEIKEWIKTGADECRPEKPPKRKHWLSDETYAIVEERQALNYDDVAKMI